MYRDDNSEVLIVCGCQRMSVRWQWPHDSVTK